MKYILLLLFTSYFISCAPAQGIQVSVDPTLQVYLDSFQRDIGVDPSGISIGFADTESLANPLGETVGECTIWSNGTKQIQIDSGYWATISDTQKTELVYHELGHCAMLLQHIVGLDTNGCPLSIMYPYTFGDSPCFAGNERAYFKQLSSL